MFPMFFLLSNRITACILLGTVLLGSGGRAVAQKTPESKKQEPKKQEKKKTVIGDITISDWNQLNTNFNGSAQVTGPDTQIEIPDKNSRSKLGLHADDIKIENAGAGKAIVTMKGH